MITITKFALAALLMLGVASAAQAGVVRGSAISAVKAQENRDAGQRVRSSVSRSRIEGRRLILGLPASALTPAPSNRPGGVCDWGDNPQIC
jgi:hypothetical protein